MTTLTLTIPDGLRLGQAIVKLLSNPGKLQTARMVRDLFYMPDTELLEKIRALGEEKI